MDPVLAMGSSISCSSFFAPPTSLVPSSSSFSPPSSIICASSASDDAPVEAGDGGGNGDAGGKGKNNNGNNNDDSNNDGDEEDDFLNLEQAEEIAAAKGIELPEDFINAAREGGLRKSVLQQYGIIATGGLVTGFLARTVPAFRDRLIADRLYFFKILAEVAIDSGCATVAELRKRGDEFWDEFEFYLSDLVVGLVLDVVLVTLLAPIAVPGRKKKVAASGLRRWATQLPSGVFEKSSAGRKYSITDRVGCYVARAMEYSLAGMACGVVGQGIASGMMIAKYVFLFCGSCVCVRTHFVYFFILADDNILGPRKERSRYLLCWKPALYGGSSWPCPPTHVTRSWLGWRGWWRRPLLAGYQGWPTLRPQPFGL